jgi:hypothetical protein
MKERVDVLEGWVLTECKNLFYRGLGHVSLKFEHLRFPAANRFSLSDLDRLVESGIINLQMVLVQLVEAIVNPCFGYV